MKSWKYNPGKSGDITTQILEVVGKDAPKSNSSVGSGNRKISLCSTIVVDKNARYVIDEILFLPSQSEEDFRISDRGSGTVFDLSLDVVKYHLRCNRPIVLIVPIVLPSLTIFIVYGHPCFLKVREERII
jgi:hypothetical protein